MKGLSAAMKPLSVGDAPAALARVTATSAAVALMLTALAACTARHQPPATSAAAATRSTGATPSAPSTAALTTAAQQRAEAAAAHLLAAFVTPPGASRLRTAPKLPKGWQLSGPVSPSESYVVDRSQVWQVTGSPAEVITWEQVHVSRALARNATGTGTLYGTVIEKDIEFDLPPVPGKIDGRSLRVEAVDLGNGQSAIRADAVVYWLPPRPASERVPGTAASVTVTEELGADLASSRPPAPVTITDPALVRRLVDLVNALPRDVTRAVSCPMYYYRMGLTLTFRATAGSLPEAVATTFRGCGAVLLTLSGQPQPQLGPESPFTAQVLKLTGLHWKLS
jgi:hypothetical protein